MSIARKIITGDAGGPVPVDPSDPDFANVSLLLNGDGNNGANNNTFADSSSNNFAVNSNGDVYQGSVSPYGDHWSTYFDGSRSDLQIEGSGFSFGTGRFTIEAWLWRDDYASGGNEAIVSGNSGTNSSSTTFSFHVSTSGYLEFGAGTTYVSSSSVIDLGVWNHVAAVYNGSKIKLFINGVQKHSSSKDYSFSFNRFKVCTTRSNSRESKCYLSNLRILKGTALYTSAFTPPTSPLTAITNTKLLICNSNSLNDESANENAVSIGGDPKVTPFSPYATSEPLDMTTDGGSGYFDGSYLTTPDSPTLDIANSAMTVEAWIYVTKLPTGSIGSSNQGFIAARWQASGNQRSWMIVHGKDGGIGFQTAQTGTGIYDRAFSANGVIKLNTWHHIAGSWDGSTNRMFVDGVQVASIACTQVKVDPSIGITVNAIDSTLSHPGTHYLTDLRFCNNAALYTSNFTPPTGPLAPNANTALLLNFQDAGIYDYTGTSDILTAGTAQVSTSVKKYGTGSIDVRGSKYLSTSTADSFDNGGVFTVEFWVRYSDTSGNQTLIDSDPTKKFFIAYYSGGLYVSNKSSGNVISDAPHTPVVGQWYHYAVVCDGSTYKLYVDGQLIGTSIGTLESVVINKWTLGKRTDSSAYDCNCYIDDLRITKGVARYTANFTPPTAALPTY